MLLITIYVCFSVLQLTKSLKCWHCRSCNPNSSKHGMGLFTNLSCSDPFEKSCFTYWSTPSSDSTYRGCSFEDREGCVIKEGVGGKKQPWCYCKTDLCNNMTTFPPSASTEPPVAKTLLCWLCEEECDHHSHNVGISFRGKRHKPGFNWYGCEDFDKSCSTRWMDGGKERRHVCSVEDEDGCCIREGRDGTKEPWCFCKTDGCNNMTELPPNTPLCANVKSTSFEPPESIEVSNRLESTSIKSPESTQISAAMPLKSLPKKLACSLWWLVTNLLFVASLIFVTMFLFSVA